MSEVLRQFVQPYWHIPQNEEGVRKLLATALVAWSAALLPEEERADYLADIAKALPEETHRDFYATVEEMIGRKEQYFAQYKREILDFELRKRSTGYDISVVSWEPSRESESTE
jgi:hypothetical protein